MIHSIQSSADLALALNSPPGPTDDAETDDPRDNSGVWVIGPSGPNFYPFDPEATTATLAVLAHGTAAAKLTNGRWSPADTEEWTSGADPHIGVVGSRVIRDWRSVRVWHAGGFEDATVYPTLEEARHRYQIERAKMQKAADDAATEARWRRAYD